MNPVQGKREMSRDRKRVSHITRLLATRRQTGGMILMMTHRRLRDID